MMTWAYKRKSFKVAAFAALTLGATTAPVFAHHPLAGAPMVTALDGLLSGIGHPILGFDHLFFILIVGVAALFTGAARLTPLAYVVASLIGCFMMSSGVGLPFKEVVIGLSLVALGYVVLRGRALSVPVAVGMFALFGLFHGSAFGDTIADQEGGAGMAVLMGYLVGLAAVQYVLALGAAWAVRSVFNATDAASVNARLAGAVAAGVGLFLSLENAERAAFALLG